MANQVEPTDVGPLAGGDRTATDSDREQVVGLLWAAHAEGRLSGEDRDLRLRQAQAAVTFDDLVPLTRDLVSPTGPAAIGSVEYDETGATDEADQIVAVFAGTTRKHTWRVRKHTSVLTICGGAELDMTRAIFEARELEINIFCLAGGIEVIVPPGTEVDSRVGAIFGGTEVKRLAPPDGVAPRLVIKGFCGFGGLEVKNPKGSKNRG